MREDISIQKNDVELGSVLDFCTQPIIFLNFNLHGVHHIYPSRPWVFLSALKSKNDLDIKFKYHQNFITAMTEKFQPPKYVMLFPSEVTDFKNV